MKVFQSSTQNFVNPACLPCGVQTAKPSFYLLQSFKNPGRAAPMPCASNQRPAAATSGLLRGPLRLQIGRDADTLSRHGWQEFTERGVKKTALQSLKAASSSVPTN